jgi:hypothetical protein
MKVICRIIVLGEATMINNWQVPRNKRKLYPVVDILSLFTLQNLGDVWNHNLNSQLDFEAELERYGIKRPGQRRDRRAGGARTYESWLYNLGLIFTETNTNIIRTTLAGEALLAGQPPVPIITNQLMKLQYPSPYSIRSRVNINPRFQIRPFRFLLRLLADNRIHTLSKEEIGRFVITEGENESINCFNHVVQRILSYRSHGDTVLPSNFEELYQSSTTGLRSREQTIAYLEDIANTFINYLEYTQLISRDENGHIFIPQERINDVASILNDGTTLRTLDTNHPFGIEIFQRNFGLAPGQNRDNRNFGGQTVTDKLYRERRVRSELLHIAGTRPVTNFTATLINEISNSTGYTVRQVEEALDGFRPDTFSMFEASYLNMAISGTELATEFEIATQGIFEQLGFHSTHVGHNPLNPDVFVESPLNFSGVIDTKAYRTYSINNDHRNRMINNYIPTYQAQHGNVEFFMYVADGFGSNIDSQLQSIAQRANVNGSVITARNLIRILQRNQINPIDHNSLRSLFIRNTRIIISDIDSL